MQSSVGVDSAWAEGKMMLEQTGCDLWLFYSVPSPLLIELYNFSVRSVCSVGCHVRVIVLEENCCPVIAYLFFC